jgi:hypothetical protein
MSLVFPTPPSKLLRFEPKAWSTFDERVTRTDKNYETPVSVADWPPIDHLVTEDEQPVDNLPSAKQQRLLVESLYSSWAGPGGGGPFLADANIGVFATAKAPPLVPDMFLSLNVQVAKDWWQKRHRSYLVWEFLKPPDVVIEIVSNREGDEDGSKLRDYARMGIRYYLIFDPTEQLGKGVLRVYELRRRTYVETTTRWLTAVGLGVTLWNGTYEDKEEVWLRWCDSEGNLILTGAERATQEYHRAEQECQRAEQEHQRAEQERQEKEQALSQLAQERQEKELVQSQLAQERQHAEQERQEKELVLSQLAQARAISAQERLQHERLLAQLRALGVEPE